VFIVERTKEWFGLDVFCQDADFRLQLCDENEDIRWGQQE
jgi:hypothetical protein